MKITLEIPDTTICAFFDFVYYGSSSLMMQGHSIEGSDIYDGSEIVIRPGKQEATDAK